MFKAIIVGSTGATGRQLLDQLLKNPNCELVTSVGRKSALDGEKNDKLKDIVIDSLADLSSTKDSWKGNDVFFNCIGTTRQRAGSAKEFIHIEAGISNEAARMASNAKINHASLISAKGANHKAWAKSWIHPLLYIRTMGQKEQTVLSNFSFNHVTIFRPGMLIRLRGKQPWFEKVYEARGLGLRVDILAASMVRDAENILLGEVGKSHQIIIGNDKIRST